MLFSNKNCENRPLKVRQVLSWGADVATICYCVAHDVKHNECYFNTWKRIPRSAKKRCSSSASETFRWWGTNRRGKTPGARCRNTRKENKLVENLWDCISFIAPFVIFFYAHSVENVAHFYVVMSRGKHIPMNKSAINHSLFQFGLLEKCYLISKQIVFITTLFMLL